MKQLFVFLSSFSMLFSVSNFAFAQAKGLDRPAFYQAMRDDNLKAVESQLSSIGQNAFAGKEAFTGALTMKKAGLVSKPGRKLSLFKEGHKQLEAELKKDADNAEFRFLRLMIQEQAPGILGYKDEIKTDSEFIKNSYKKLSPEVQKAILDYASNKSKILKATDFN